MRELDARGVEYKFLGDVGTFVRGNGLQKKDLLDSGVPAIHYGQIHTHYGVWTTQVKSFVTPEFASKLRHAEPGDLVIATTSEGDDAVGKATAWLGDEPAAVSGDAYIYRHTLDPKYIAYFFQSEHFQVQKKAGITGTKVRRISGHSLARIRVPVPPLEIQREIVKILDALTGMKAELEAELGAELEARRRQYAHYRGRLLVFASDTEWMALDQIAEYTNGKAHERLVDPEGEIPMVTARFISRNGVADRFVRSEGVRTLANKGDIALVLSDLPNGRALARTFFIDRDGGYAINQRVARLRVKDSNEVEPRFLFHVLNRNPALLKHDNGVDQTHLSKGQVTELRLPVPPLDEQRRIVGILDEFDALVNDLSSGLTAEVEARRQQYAHYRDRLLSFEEATS
ncbi:restriction endonuclease subunit S [Cellulosimicrobium funkei]|uniref:restriction endonuclease subunit S n=1 Tax=Cellulosimicrobium funkei TaxID=264251 RepID=UPI0030FB333B